MPRSPQLIPAVPLQHQSSTSSSIHHTLPFLIVLQEHSMLILQHPTSSFHTTGYIIGNSNFQLRRQAGICPSHTKPQRFRSRHGPPHEPPVQGKYIYQDHSAAKSNFNKPAYNRQQLANCLVTVLPRLGSLYTRRSLYQAQPVAHRRGGVTGADDVVLGLAPAGKP